MKNWKTVKEGQVRSVWQCTHKDCGCDKKEVLIDPSWYNSNGTPVCEIGQDMDYIRTEIADCSEGLEDDLAIVEVVMVEVAKA